MRIPYKAYPIGKPEPAFPGLKERWVPVLPIRLTDRRLQVKTKNFHAIVDSGSDMCFFHADALTVFRLKLEDGIAGEIGGIAKKPPIPVFYHDIHILVGLDWLIEVRAGFSRELTTAGILGRLGFFDSFRVIFDHSTHPPVLEIQKLEHKTLH